MAGSEAAGAGGRRGEEEAAAGAAPHMARPAWGGRGGWAGGTGLRLAGPRLGRQANGGACSRYSRRPRRPQPRRPMLLDFPGCTSRALRPLIAPPPRRPALWAADSGAAWTRAAPWTPWRWRRGLRPRAPSWVRSGKGLPTLCLEFVTLPSGVL